MLDVIVVGGGPTGSSAAARLATCGFGVLLLEAERFPRFHIGESLLPASVPLFEALGVKDELDRTYLRKNAAELVSFDGRMARRYPFAGRLTTGASHAYEVDRQSFDALLLDNAARLGAKVEIGAEVTAVGLERDRVTVTARAVTGRPMRLCARFLVDASGQRSLLARQLGLRVMDRELKNVALYSHYEGAARHSGEREGDISIVLSPEGWWWVIPLANDRTSVGMVAPGRAYRGRKLDLGLLEHEIARSKYLSERLGKARRVEPVRTAADYSYASRRFTGERWLLAGDAAAFIDPVFSTGVCLGMLSAFRGADAVRALLKGDTRSGLRDYERWLGSALGTYRRFVRAFYTPEMVELLLHPTDRLDLRAAVTSLLAGEAAERPHVAWRTHLFLLLARANRHLPIVPRMPERRGNGESS